MPLMLAEVLSLRAELVSAVDAADECREALRIAADNFRSEREDALSLDIADVNVPGTVQTFIRASLAAHTCLCEAMDAAVLSHQRRFAAHDRLVSLLRGRVFHCADLVGRRDAEDLLELYESATS